jgi:hypothetical protein
VKAEDLYHTGIVVEDFDATLSFLSEAAGYRWCDPYAGDVPIVTPQGERTVPMRMAYSVTEPRLELIEAIPGTVWVPADSGVHHLGYWSDDVDGDAAALMARGLSVEVKAPSPDGSSMWAYCKGDAGPRIELVSRLIAPALRQMFAAGGAAGR